MKGRVVPWLFPLVIIAAGLMLRLHRLDGASLWGDEACMLDLAQKTPTGIVSVLAADRPDVDVAPPLYFFTLRAFTSVFGLTTASARAMSVLFSLASLGLLYALGMSVFGHRPALYALCLMAGSAFHLWYAQEARMYAMATALAVLATHLFLRFLRSGSARDGVPYAIVMAAALYTQYYAYLLLAAHILCGGIHLAVQARRRGEAVARALLPLAIIAVLLSACVVPWLPVVLRDFGHAQIPGFPSEFSLLLSLPFVLAKFAVFGNEAFVRDHAWLYAAAAPLFGWYFARGALALYRPWPAAPWLCLGFIALPMALVSAASALGASVYKSHPFIILSPLFYLLLGQGLSRARGRRGEMALALMLACNLFVALRLNFGDDYAKPKVRDALAYVAGAMRPGDLLLKVPAKLHQEPVETGEILSWRYYAPAGLDLRELNGAEATLAEKLDEATAGRSRFFLAFAETQFTRDLEPKLLAHAARSRTLVERSPFPSRMRDFGLVVYLFQSPSLAGRSVAAKAAP